MMADGKLGKLDEYAKKRVSLEEINNESGLVATEIAAEDLRSC